MKQPFDNDCKLFLLFPSILSKEESLMTDFTAYSEVVVVEVVKLEIEVDVGKTSTICHTFNSYMFHLHNNNSITSGVIFYKMYFYILTF